MTEKRSTISSQNVNDLLLLHNFYLVREITFLRLNNFLNTGNLKLIEFLKCSNYQTLFQASKTDAGGSTSTNDPSV